MTHNNLRRQQFTHVAYRAARRLAQCTLVDESDEGISGMVVWCQAYLISKAMLATQTHCSKQCQT